MQFFFFLIKTILTFFILLALCLVFLVSTPFGTQIVFYGLKPTLPKEIKIKRVRGVLLHGIDLSDVRYQQNTLQISIKRVHITWQWHALFKGRFQLNATTLRELRINEKALDKEIIWPIVRFNGFIEWKAPHRLRGTLRVQENKTLISGDLRRFTIENITGDTRLNGEITLDWKETLTWHAQFALQSFDPQTIQTDWPSGKIHLKLISEGHYQKEDLQQKVTLNIKDSEWNHQALNATLQLEQDTKKITLSTGTLQLGNNHLTLTGKWDDHIALEWSVQATHLQQIFPEFSGVLNSHGTLAGLRHDPTITVKVDGQALVFKTQKLDQLTLALKGTLHEHTLEATLHEEKNKRDLALTVIGGYQNQEWKGKLTTLTIDADTLSTWQLVTPTPVAFKNKKWQLRDLCLHHTNNQLCFTAHYRDHNQYELSIQIPQFDLAQFETIHTDNVAIAGILRGHLQLTHENTWLAKGHLSLEKGKLKQDAFGVDVDDIQLAVTGNNTSTLHYQGSARLGEGRLTLKGKTELSEHDIQSELTLQGDHIHVLNTPELTLFASTDLVLEQKKKQLSLKGRVTIPEAMIKPKDFHRSQEASDDIVFVTQSTKKNAVSEKTDRFDFSSEVTFLLGDKVKLNYKGLTGELKGELTVIEDPERLTKASGELRIVDGHYKAYGQNLTITEGRLIYSQSPINNPIIHLSATRKVQLSSEFNLNTNKIFGEQQTTALTKELTVGIRLSGHLREPRIDLFSTPDTLKQSDILSLLVLGRTLNTATQNDSQMLLTALSALNLSAADKNSTLQQLHNKLGIDFSVESTTKIDPETTQTLQNTALILGKALSPRLYIRYSYGILDGENSVQLLYKLRHNLTLQTQTNGDVNAIDILYTLER